MRFKVLGRIRVENAGTAVPLGGPKQQVVLACLIMRGNTLVPFGTLVDSVWLGNEPPQVRPTVHAYVSRLRKALACGVGATRIRWETGGYRLRIEQGELDADEFDARVTAARAAWAAGDLVAARAGLRSALALWDGPALSGMAGPLIDAHVARLSELRAIVWEECVDVDLALGNHVEVIPELCTLIRDHPLREGLASRLMIAYYRHGRTADALRVYRRTRAELVRELGIEPGPELRRLHRRILQSDPTLRPHQCEENTCQSRVR
nr:AfsR/SARP family transcriptional regulator [Kibdelosporangium sp. MJ126-NF4]CEL20005.1 transcriptional regulator, SARP family [Kibdelosporangium sp. MJ126-NF4]CTQ97229.1 transcriptional regulator, SARP family [Kibdelosporangium sp. MJ126-NF4]